MGNRLVLTGHGNDSVFALARDANGYYIDWNGKRIDASIFGDKNYIARLTQNGANAPVPAIVSNTLGAPLVWTRNAAGSYTGTLAGAFPAGRVFVTSLVLGTGGPGMIPKCSRLDDNSIIVFTLDAAGAAVDFGGELNLAVQIRSA